LNPALQDCKSGSTNDAPDPVRSTAWAGVAVEIAITAATANAFALFENFIYNLS
jgi:hypothetical protein